MQEEKAIFGRLRRSAALAAEPRDSPPPSAAPAAGGWGSPAPACKYGRVGWGTRCRRRGEGGAGGGGFGVGEAFSGGAAPGGSPSSSPTCGGSTPGVVLEFFEIPSDLGRRWICCWDLRAELDRHLLSASSSTAAVARWRSWTVGAFAVSVHRLMLRRCAADDTRGVLLHDRCSRGVVRRRTAACDFAAGGAVSICFGSFPLRILCCFSFLYFVLCTLYVFC